WLALIEILGWLAFPIAYLVLRALPDRGYIFAKPLGILFPAWAAWMLASFHALPFSRVSIALAIALVAVVGAVIVWRRGREIFAFLRAQWRVVLIEQVLYLIFFGAFLLIRYGNPDLWHPYFGGEKPMDFAYLNAIVKSTWFPPYDPWFAGGYINYYYFGQLITATLIRFSGIVPEVAYNLALPMYFAMTAMGAFSVAFNLVARKNVTPALAGGARVASPEGAKQSPSPDTEIASSQKPLLAMTGTRYALFAGLLAAIFVAAIGNLGQVILIGQTLVKIGGGDPTGPIVPSLLSAFAGAVRVVIDHQPFEVPLGWWYWNASRVIPDTINEFPFFTFTYADLHAHLMALPFTLVVLGVAANFALRVRTRDDSARLPFLAQLPISPVDVFEVVLAGLALGALRAINYADFATYQLVIACAVAIGEFARRRRIDLAWIGGVAWRLVGIVLLSTLLWQPFVSNFATAYLSVELWTGARTTLDQYLVVHGIFLFAIATYLVVQTFDSKTTRGLFRFLRLALSRWSRVEHALALQRAFAAPPTAYEDLVAIAALVAVVIEGILLLAQLPVFVLAFPLLVLAGLLVLRPDLDPARRWIALLIAAGLALTMVVEFVV
ncbi:MAG: DUF2298 domain-containing protein, partial [Chloroflexota bacterium]|nr:DUF2298 domain-containing protein [Chloroflexota bacterium]